MSSPPKKRQSIFLKIFTYSIINTKFKFKIIPIKACRSSKKLGFVNPTVQLRHWDVTSLFGKYFSPQISKCQKLKHCHKSRKFCEDITYQIWPLCFGIQIKNLVPLFWDSRQLNHTVSESQDSKLEASKYTLVPNQEHQVALSKCTAKKSLHLLQKVKSQVTLKVSKCLPQDGSLARILLRF